MRALSLFLLSLVPLSAFTVWAATPRSYQFCIIGAGPGGLQLGYFLQQSGRDYVIFEKNNTAGSFYLHYPRHRTLISINKRFTGTLNHEFNLRHDWNSLLSHDSSLELRHYTKDYFPSADVYVQYLKDYAAKLNINIQFRTEVLNIEKSNTFELKLAAPKGKPGMCTCDTVIASTGIWVPVLPKVFGQHLIEGYETMSVDPEDFDGQSVLILGKGNAGFETAQNIVGSAAYIHMLSRNRVRQAYQTHYVGDLRAINNQLVDTYQLKSLDGIDRLSLKSPKHRIEKLEDGSLEIVIDAKLRDNVGAIVYDRIIDCTGFKFDFSIFGNTTAPITAFRGKYPAMTDGFKSKNTEDLYFAGTASHYIDFRHSAGGFIHGFRYNSRALFKHLEWQYNSVKWPSLTIQATDLTDHIVKRVNEASGLYQMFGVLADVALLSLEDTAVYLEDVPIGALSYGQEYTGHAMGPLILITFEYGKNFSGPGADTLNGKVQRNAERAHLSNFLHPILYYFKNVSTLRLNGFSGALSGEDLVFHLVEDFKTNWTARSSHILPLRRFVEAAFQSDLRKFLPQDCFKNLFTHGSHMPHSCKVDYLPSVFKNRMPPPLEF